MRGEEQGLGQLTRGSVQGLCELTMDVPGAAEGLRTIADLLAFEHIVSPGTQFTCFTRTKLQILTQKLVQEYKY